MSELSVNLNAATRISQTTDPRTSDEFQLMTRLAGGDRPAMHDLIESHGEMLARLIGRLTSWHTDRDDILQDVLIAVWQNAGSYSGNGSLEGWLKRIAINRCKNHFRATSSVRRLIEGFIQVSKPQEQIYNVGEHEDDTKSKLQQAMKKLSLADRTMLVLFYLEEMPGDELAIALNLKPETLHVRLHRARKRLKQIIEEQSDEV